MSRKVTGTDAFEVEVTLSGTYRPGCPERGPTYASGGQPAEPEMVEDLEVTGLFGLRRVPATTGLPLPGRMVWEKVNLLDGVDPKSDAYLKIIANLQAFVGKEVMENALLLDMEDAA